MWCPLGGTLVRTQEPHLAKVHRLEFPFKIQHPLELKEGHQVSCSTRRVSGRLRVCSWRTGAPLIYLAIDSQRIDLTWASGYDGPGELFCIHAVFNPIIFTAVDTAGKCHDRGFMAFDWQSTDTCHGVGQALHKSLCSFVGVGSRSAFRGLRSAIIRQSLPPANFAWAPGFKSRAKQIHCTAGVGADKGHKMYRFPDPVWNETMARTKGFVQCLANAMASVGALPIKCHEPTVMALACSVIQILIMRSNA
ncbi:hypothetical protein DFH08DRAFT_819388 [Mycena albidolilacea]|uniref:Uncharacterized protein n=1 Tax=Mycena albidolilacea TaxID=1033008 RepID=A0AAD7EEY1_9AGAR|nr:hypothetical protein DFH08DRAFT_819388 [Mycena albidolilacea]